MSDFAPNFTARYRLRYISLSQPHHVTFRHIGPGRTPAAGFVAGVVSFLNASAAIRYSDWTVLEATSAAENSDLFLPEPLPTGLTAGAATPGPTSFRPVFFSLQGQSDDGNKCAVYMFGCALDPTVPTPGVQLDYRITGAEDATTLGIINALQAIPDQVAIDRQACNWHSYINLAYNSYWQRKQRG
jgi:hypothetical protein